MSLIEKFSSTPEVQAEYSAWLKMPMTQMAIEMVREHHRAVMPALGGLEKPIELLATCFAEQTGIETALFTLVNLARDLKQPVEVPADWSEESNKEDNNGHT